MNVRVVLDGSALLTYARLDGLAVGELIAMVEEDGGEAVVGIPAASFLPAYAALSADERVRLVAMATAIDGVTAILPLQGCDAVEVAELDSRLGEPGLAPAIVEVSRHDSLLATYAPAAARTVVPHDRVLDLN